MKAIISIAAMWCLSTGLVARAQTAEPLQCYDLKSCIEATQTAISTIKHYDFRKLGIPETFDRFGQEGFDALFDMALNAEHHKASFVSALKDLKINRASKMKRIPVTRTQFNRLKDHWHTSLDHAVLDLMNSVDANESHTLMMTALFDLDTTRREATRKFIARSGFGTKHSPVDSIHLEQVLSLLEDPAYSDASRPIFSDIRLRAINILSRMDDERAREKLRQLLRSEDRKIFQATFTSLDRYDRNGLWTDIRQLPFENSDADISRAVMIARIIEIDFNKVEPNAHTLNYWTDWFSQESPDDPRRLIPAYMIFDIFGKTQSKVSSHEENLARARVKIAEHQASSEQILKGISNVDVIDYYQRQIARQETYPPLLETAKAFIHANETELRKSYFRIFRANKSGYIMGYGQNRQLPFQSFLKHAVKDKTAWTAGLSANLNCGQSVNNYDLLKHLADNKPNDPALHLCLERELRNTANIPTQIRALTFLSTYPTLRSVPSLRAAVRDIDAESPFTSVRIARRDALSDAPQSRLNAPKRIAYSSWLNKDVKALNTQQNYCEPPSQQTFNYLKSAPFFKYPASKTDWRLGEAKHIVKTPSGYLSGHNRGEFGGGLLYYPDLESKAISLGSWNMIAIFESDARGVYWGLHGLNHMIPGEGTIIKIDARTDDVKVSEHLRMPIVTNSVTRLKNGDLFMDYWTRERTTYSRTEGTKTHANPREEYNPPVIFTRSGALKVGCPLPN